jgi:hypothetical protein
MNARLEKRLRGSVNSLQVGRRYYLPTHDPQSEERLAQRTIVPVAEKQTF